MISINSSRILAIDPGEMTGISFLKDGEFVWGMVCRPESFDSETFIFSLTKITQPTTIVIESPPTQTLHYNKDQYRIFDLLERTYKVAGYNVITMNPGQWKALTNRIKIDAGHMRDAADMGKVQYSREQRKAKVSS